MKKLWLFIIAWTALLPVMAQENGNTKEPFILPGNGHINVENLNKSINTKMDVSKLSLSEVYVLRNAYAARQGYCFETAELRSIFQTTSWYDQKLWDRFEREQQLNAGNEGEYRQLPLKYTKQEQAFIDKLTAREKQLLDGNGNFKAKQDGWRVNTDNLLNPYQLEELNPQLLTALGKNGFAIVPDNKIQLFHIYEKNDYHDFPSFVTTDLYLQLFHLYFDTVLRSIEEEKLCTLVANLCQQLYDELGAVAAQTTNKEIKDAAEYDQAFAAVGLSLITGEPLKPLAEGYSQMAADEIKHVMASENAFSDFLEYQNVMFSYSLFRPRGHYTRSETVKRYFRAMMWLQTVPFCINKEHQLKRAAVLADVVGRKQSVNDCYRLLFDPITFLMGAPDNVTILDVFEEVQKLGMPLDKAFKKKKVMATLAKAIETRAEAQTRILPKVEVTCRYKINLMPQRYQPDAEVLNEMVDVESPVSKRATPMGLDVMAAMGNSAAERILMAELQQDKLWELYTPTLQKMKQRMGDIDWTETVATRWMETLQTMTQQQSEYPYFMLTPQWQKKDLNAALASWAELKHDAILYAKQPMAAECGDYGPPEPIVKGYVEPNTAFWKKAIGLTETMTAFFEKYGLTTERVTTTTQSLRDQAEFLLAVSEKELRGEELTEQEYNSIEIIGATFENISLDLIREKDQYLQGWDNVESADKEISVVADVYTANSENNPKQSILYEGVGPAYEIYVVVEIGGYLYLTRGAVFSYREFERPLYEQRMTDEEWQQKLKEYPNTGLPTWMEEITVPLRKTPDDNEHVFYSTGC